LESLFHSPQRGDSRVTHGRERAILTL